MNRTRPRKPANPNDSKGGDRLELRLGRLHAVLAAGAYRYDNEKDLQDQIEARLQAAGLRYKREAPLAKNRGIPDFLVGVQPWVVLEVKIKGSRNELIRQVDKYLGDGRVGACLVATTRTAHRDLPRIMRDKRLRTSWLSAAGALGGPTNPKAPAAAPSVGQLVRTATGWAVNLEAHAMGRFKRMFTRVRAKQYGTIELDDRRETCRDLLWYTSRYPLQASELDLLHLQVQADKYDRQQARVASIANGTLRPRDFTMLIPPRPYQQLAAEMALQGRGLLVGDELGLGKTVTGIAALTDPTTRPALVVTLTHLAGQWADELARFAPELVTHVINKGQPYDVTRPKGARKTNGDQFHVPGPRGPLADDRPFPDVLITTYSKLKGWADVLAPVINGLVFDEVQELRKGDDTAKGKAAYHLARNAGGLRLGLSATPVYNYADEIHAVMEGIAPGALGTRAEFVQEWCSAQGSTNHRVRDPAALGSYLRAEGLMIRRTRADVGRELPPLHNVPVLVAADLEALGRAEREVADLARAILGESTPNLERGRAAREMDVKLRQATGIAKAPYVAAFVKGLFADGADRVVLGGWHREVYRIWQDLLQDFKPVLYTGTESPARKRQAKRQFVSGESRLLIMSLRSGAGLDGLQEIGCTNVVYGELDWSPMVHKQFSGRIHRDGQPDPCTAWYLHTDGGSDPTVLDVLGVKRSQSAGILDPTNADPEAPADASHARALARRLLGRSS